MLAQLLITVLLAAMTVDFSAGLQQRRMEPASTMQRTRSQELVPDNNPMLDEDPLLISQTLTYVTDDGSVLHAFQSAPFTFGRLVGDAIIQH
jgi:hypothetical protein